MHFTVLLSQDDQPPDTGGLEGREGDMYEDAPLTLTDRRRVWLWAATRPIPSDEQGNIDLIESEFRAFSFSGRQEELTDVAGMRAPVAEPRIVLFPLGWRHFTFGK